MKGNRLLKTALAGCALILIASAALGVGTILTFADFFYENADKYTAGDAELNSPVKNLDVDWINGKVNIEYHGKKTVLIKEASNKKISEDMLLRWWLDGETLRIRYAKQHIRLNGKQKKELTITLPEGTVFEDVDISSTSGALNIPSLEAKDLTLETTSGDIMVKADAQKINTSVTSGDIWMDLGSTESLSVNTTSGEIDVQAEAAKEVRLDSTSGDISVSLKDFDDLRIDATSGDVTASLPVSPGYTARIDTTSGSFSSSAALKQEGKVYSCGDGSARVTIDTTSGDVRLKHQSR